MKTMCFTVENTLYICTKILMCLTVFSKLFSDKGMCPNWRRKYHLKRARLILGSSSNLSIKYKFQLSAPWLHGGPLLWTLHMWPHLCALTNLVSSECPPNFVCQEKKTLLLRPITNIFLWLSCSPICNPTATHPTLYLQVHLSAATYPAAV